MITRTNKPPPRRGIAAVVMVVLLLILNVIIVGMVLSGARDEHLTVRRLETVQAFYAAEAGINMAVRERLVCEDEDGDGAIATISDDAADGTDPIIGTGTTAQVVVTKVDDCPTSSAITVTSRARSGQSMRVAEAVFDYR
jgi:Tfp pilus assembly protein PilX